VARKKPADLNTLAAGIIRQATEEEETVVEEPEEAQTLDPMEEAEEG